MRVAREDPIVGIPIIRIRDRICVDVPAPARIPVRVHSPLVIVHDTIRSTTHRSHTDLRVESYAGPPKSTSITHRFFFFFGTPTSALGTSVPVPILKRDCTEMRTRAVTSVVFTFPCTSYQTKNPSTR
jgi:hypothetical protein